MPINGTIYRNGFIVTILPITNRADTTHSALRALDHGVETVRYPPLALECVRIGCQLHQRGDDRREEGREHIRVEFEALYDGVSVNSQDMDSME